MCIRDRIVGMTPAAKNAAVNSLLIKVAPGLKDIPTEFAQGDAINVEELLKLDPDVVLYNTDSDVYKRQDKRPQTVSAGARRRDAYIRRGRTLCH